MPLTGRMPRPRYWFASMLNAGTPRDGQGRARPERMIRARATGCRVSSLPEASFLGRTAFAGDLVT